jgi:hypothetical protein
MFRLFRDVPAGLVVASSDVLLLIPEAFPIPAWPQEGATGLGIPTDKHLGPNHGVYQIQQDVPVLSPDGKVSLCPPVKRFWQKATVPELAEAGAVRTSDQTVILDTGVSERSSYALLVGR